MKCLSATILGLVLTATSSFGDTFNFEYVFGDGVTTASGVLSGTQVGDDTTGHITNFTVLSLNFAGHQIGGDGAGGTLFSSKYDNSVGMVAGAVVSFDASQLNFMFSTQDLANGVYGSGNPAFGAFYIFNYALSFNPNYKVFDSGGYSIPSGNINSNVRGVWSLVNMSTAGNQVPDGGTSFALFGTASLLLSVLRRVLDGTNRH